MLRRICLMLGLISACGVDRVGRVEPSVDVQPAVLDFGDVVVGEPTWKEVTLTNRTRASVHLTVISGGPFVVNGHEVWLAGGESRALTVELIAPAPGLFESTLTAEPGGTIDLRAQAALRLECGDPGECHSFTTSCERVPSEDGTSCESACLTASRCVAGRCLGTPLDCDDGDPCTRDSCGEAGCVHVPAVCEVLADPCKVARCDPTLGCVIDDLLDGTSCGTNDCSTAHVCLAGRCVARPTPEGSTCPASGICSSEGRCQSGACVPTGTRPLTPAWTFDTGGGIGNEGLRADEDGNIYYLARTTAPNSRQLVSLDSEGRVRFRVTSGLPPFDAPLFLVSGGFVVLASTTHRFGPAALLEVYSASNGALLWARTHEALFPVPETPICSSVPSTWIGADGAGHLFVRATMHSRCSDVGVGFAVLDLTTGNVLSRRRTSPWATGSSVPRFAVIDSQGRWVYAEPDGSQLAAWSLSGTQAWNTAPGYALVAATPGGRLISSAGAVLHPMGTAVAASTVTTASPRGGALTGRLERAFFLTHTSGREQVEKFDLTSPSTVWSHPLVQSGTQASAGFFGVLTARDSVVFPSRNTSLGQTQLVELSWEGDEVARCTLSSGQAFDAILPVGQAVLLPNRWVTYDGYRSRLNAYDVPGLTPAQHGWVTTAGTQGGEMRPQ